MRVPTFILATFGAAAMFLGGCSTAPVTTNDRAQLHNDSQAAYDDFKTTDPSLDNLLSHSYGYVIFPSVGKGAVGVGGAYGQGEVFEQGHRVGYADMTQANVGAALGGQTFSELIVLRTQDTMERFKSGQYTFTADVSAVAAKAGAAADAKWENDTVVFTNVKGGLMADASVGGQKFGFVALQNTQQ